MTGTPEQFIRICTLHEAQVADARRAARRADRLALLRDASLSMLQLCVVAAVVGLVVL